MKCPRLWTEYLRDMKKEFRGYNAATLSKDIMAGITVAAVALPLALAFGVGAGASAAAGMVTAIIGGIIIGSLSGASFQISGPTGAMMAILLTLVAREGLTGMLAAGFLAGLMLVIAGFLRLGQMIYFIPSSVITGFTSGIALIIALGQLDAFLGVKSQGDLVILKILSYFQQGVQPDPKTIAIGAFVIVLMLVWPKAWGRYVPSSLVALIAVLVLNAFLHWEVATVGAIPRSLFLSDRLHIGDLAHINWRHTMMPALSIAALAMIESLLCGASAGKLKEERLRGDRELVAQGIGNLIIPFFGGVPATAAIARTSVVIRSGGVTRIAGIVHALVLLASMFILTPVMAAIPLSALSGVLMVTAWRMNDWANIHFIFEHRFKSGMAKYLITMIATVMLDLTQAIIVGVLVSVGIIVARMTHVDINVSRVDNARLKKIGMGLDSDHIPEPSEVMVVYLTGTIFFGAADKLRSRLLALDHTDALILSMRGVPTIDLSGMQVFIEIVQALHATDTKIILTSVQPRVMRYFERSGFVDMVGRDNVYTSAEQAIIACVEDHC